MFKSNKKINLEPWDISFWERLTIIRENSKKKKIVYIYEIADTSTFRYRVYNMCQSLKESKDFVGSYFFVNEIEQLSEYIDDIDILIIVRTRWSIEMDMFIQKVKEIKIPILFDIDDLVFNIKKIPLVMNTLNVQFNDPNCYDVWFAYASRFWLMGQLCDATIGTNKYLTDRLSDYFKKPSHIVNNFLNLEQIEVSEEIYLNRKKKQIKSRKRFKIGYFSGTPTHINDFKKIAPELLTLMDKYPDIDLEVVGFMEFPDYLEHLSKAGRIKRNELVDFLTLQKKISQSDINVIPLVDNEFSNCKSELKFFEAAIVGTTTCATPTFVYKNNIKNGINGFLCNEGEWASTIEDLYINGINDKIITSAREYCLKKYSPTSQLKNIENMLRNYI